MTLVARMAPIGATIAAMPSPPAGDIPYKYVYDQADRDLQGAIWQVIERVPAEVQRFIKEKCTFASLGSSESQMLVLRTGGLQSGYLLVLDERTPSVGHVARAVARAWARYHSFDRHGRDSFYSQAVDFREKRPIYVGRMATMAGGPLPTGMESAQDAFAHPGPTGLPGGAERGWAFADEEQQAATLLAEWGFLPT
jgi:hypothetical protein